MKDAGAVVLITGAARGIGAAAAEEFGLHGWQVARADLGFDDAAASLDIHLDVRDADAVNAAVAAVVDRFGRLDALVNNAGVQKHALLAALDDMTWSEVLDVNLTGALHCLQAAGKVMLRAGRGAIINVVSVVGYRGASGRAPYAASKAALTALTQTAAVEWGAHGVRVNAIAPGYVETPMVMDAIESGAVPLEAILARTPLGRLARPREIAAAMRYLASEDASFITGQVLFVDGGFMADLGVPMGSNDGR